MSTESQAGQNWPFLPELIIFVIRIGYPFQEGQLLVQVHIERLKNNSSEMPNLNKASFLCKEMALLPEDIMCTNRYNSKH
jgi:hypothetical protein